MFKSVCVCVLCYYIIGCEIRGKSGIACDKSGTNGGGKQTLPYIIFLDIIYFGSVKKSLQKSD